MSFVLDSMEVIGGKYLIGKMEIIFSESLIVQIKVLSAANNGASAGLGELSFKLNVGDHLKCSFCSPKLDILLSLDSGKGHLVSPWQPRSLLAACKRADYPAGGAVPAGKVRMVLTVPWGGTSCKNTKVENCHIHSSRCIFLRN